MANERTYNVWVLLYPAPDVKDQWVAHALDFDVVTQGNTLEHAIQMAHEACTMVGTDDLEGDRDPMQRRAPHAFYDALYKLMNSGRHVDKTELRELAEQQAITLCATQIEVNIRLEDGTGITPASMRPVPFVFAEQHAC